MKKLFLLSISLMGLLLGVLQHKATAQTANSIATPLNLTEKLPDYFDDDGKWDIIINNLYKIPDNSILNFLVSGNGGIFNVVNDVKSAIEQAKQRGIIVNMTVTSEALSGHGYLLCSATKVVLEPGTKLMIHGPRSTQADKFGVFINTHYYQTAADKEAVRALLRGCVEKQLLTNQDVELINKGYKIIVYKKLDGNIVKVLENEQQANQIKSLENFLYAISLLILVIGLILLIK